MKYKRQLPSVSQARTATEYKDPFYNEPWNPGYSLPPYLQEEDPLTRGSAVVTAQIPRGTISRVQGLSQRTAGYSLPQYLRDEPVGSQARTTPWTKGGTVMSMKMLKTGLPWKSSAHTLDSNGLGALGSTSKGKSSVGGSNPIEAYGQKASVIVEQALAAVPVGQREAEMRKLLNDVDPKLFAAYKKEQKQLKDIGASSAVARSAGLAVAFSQGFTKDLMKIGKTGKKPAPGIRKGHVSLGALMGFEAQANNYEDLGGIGSSIKSALKKLGGLACDVATNPVTPIAAGAAGAYYGGPQGASTAMAGAGMAAAACSAGGSSDPQFYQPAPSAMPVWAIPAIIGGGAIALVLVLTRK
jgi:hypothetical protein